VRTCIIGQRVERTMIAVALTGRRQQSFPTASNRDSNKPRLQRNPHRTNQVQWRQSRGHCTEQTRQSENDGRTVAAHKEPTKFNDLHGDGRNVLEHKSHDARVSNDHLYNTRDNNSSRDGAHRSLKALAVVRNRLEFGIKDDPKGGRQIAKGSALDNRQTIYIYIEAKRYARVVVRGVSPRATTRTREANEYALVSVTYRSPIDV
jgi:hypothetical protein